MSWVKSFAVGNGDMYYIRHGSDNFTIIDCSIPDDRKANILLDISSQSRHKSITRLISTHPDQDHISHLIDLDDNIEIPNFYCVKNAATKEHPTRDFERYVELRDSSKAFYLYRGCTRRWMNDDDEEKGYGSSGINVLWPIRDDPDFKSALQDAANALPPNNISPIFKYKVQNGVSMIWMGDLETDFMQKLVPKIDLPNIDVVFAPHHGRASGKIPHEWLKQLDPQLIVIGEAPSEYFDYYSGYNIITQNSAGDILFDCVGDRAHIYVSDHTYEVDYLLDEGKDVLDGLYYVGSLSV